jgi:4,5-DOPA dioxygenase extradiol
MMQSTPTEKHNTDRRQSVDQRMPVVFVGHGSPMNAIEDNRWSRGFAALADLVPRPRAIVAISAHWYTDASYVMANARSRTIHDFGGFPQSLYEIDYRASGHPDLARRVRDILGSEHADLNADWGLDHGTWSVLRWMFPQADIPVIQLSIDRRLDVARHHKLGKSLVELRDEGVLIIGSGNVVHNLQDAFRRMQTRSNDTPDWAHRFDETVQQTIEQHDTRRLLNLWPDSGDGRMAHPTPDHWLPLIYAQAATDDRDPVRFPMEGFDWGSISMRNIVFG